MPTIIHPRVSERHPELVGDDVRKAWEECLVSAVRIPGVREMRPGFDRQGRLLEMIGALTEEGWLVFNAMTPPSKKSLSEIRRARRSF